MHCLGHANEEVNDAIKAQLDLIAHGYRYNFTTDALEGVDRDCPHPGGRHSAGDAFALGGLACRLLIALQCINRHRAEIAAAVHLAAAGRGWQHAGGTGAFGVFGTHGGL